MKEIKFSPLRIIKKSGKITSASYMQWRKVATADYSEFNLILRKDFSEFPLSERVYNHKGELLFWYNHKDPETLPKWKPSPEMMDFLHEEFEGEHWKLHNFEIPDRLHPSVQGFDCDKVPVFSHYTLDYIGRQNMEVKNFEILTVGTVLKWYGWFLWNLQNANLMKQ